MYFAKKLLVLILPLMLLAACGDNLNPSGDDQRSTAVPGTTGPAVGQNAPDFSVSDINGNTVTLASALASKKGVVLYFSMWCPICDSHMSSIRSNALPAYPSVGFYIVDYVSGTVADARSSAIANGYANSGFTVLADIGNAMLNGYQATMGTTVVIDSTGIIRMNEDYKDGSRLLTILAGLT